MKKFTQQQIEQVKTINSLYASNKQHGNRKYHSWFDLLLVEDVKRIIEKKSLRKLLNYPARPKSEVSILRELITRSESSINTNYFKVLIEGETGIYFAHPVHQHSDYNKSRVFEKNEKTLRLMDMFNSYFSRKTNSTN